MKRALLVILLAITGCTTVERKAGDSAVIGDDGVLRLRIVESGAVPGDTVAVRVLHRSADDAAE